MDAEWTMVCVCVCVCASSLCICSLRQETSCAKIVFGVPSIDSILMPDDWPKWRMIPLDTRLTCCRGFSLWHILLLVGDAMYVLLSITRDCVGIFSVQ